MQKVQLLLLTLVSLGLISFFGGCQSQTTEEQTGEHTEISREAVGEHAETSREERGEHAETSREERGEHGEAGESHDEKSEESGERFTINQIHNAARNGIRLVLRYDQEARAFTGTVENIIEEIVPQVRVEVHLSNGVELGPTPPIDLGPGKKIPVTIPYEGNPFTWWTTHAETGRQ